MKEIDRKLIETINRYRTSGIGQQVDYEKFYLYSLITHSTAIEGSTVTEVENLLLSAKVMRRTGSEYSVLGGNFDFSKGELRRCNMNMLVL